MPYMVEVGLLRVFYNVCWEYYFAITPFRYNLWLKRKRSVLPIVKFHMYVSAYIIHEHKLMLSEKIVSFFTLYFFISYWMGLHYALMVKPNGNSWFISRVHHTTHIYWKQVHITLNVRRRNHITDVYSIPKYGQYPTIFNVCVYCIEKYAVVKFILDFVQLWL